MESEKHETEQDGISIIILELWINEVGMSVWRFVINHEGLFLHIRTLKQLSVDISQCFILYFLIKLILCSLFMG